jgi:hypothetical protein
MKASVRRLVVAGLITAATVSCADSDDSGDTLAPLPVSGPTAPSVGATFAPSATTTASLTSATEGPLLVGDWDGAEFDVGLIDRVGELGGYRTIEFDRYSYDDPRRGVIDAGAFDEEPIAYGWAESPFVNIQEQLRTFVLADDVEVLVLGGETARRGCAGRPAQPTWLSVEPSYLDLPAATEDIASLTYSPEGQVVRIRFTRGCDA